jgi:D-glycero-alpha-D-manno-heptose-7-phosphate kinase
VIICQTPLRVSFFGGGTDFPEFFEEHGGAVLATAIDKSIYHAITQFHSRLFDYSIRVAYRKVECVSKLEDLQHAPCREILRHFGVKKDVEVSLTADLPSLTGLGSSSSFTVGMINAISAYTGKFMPTAELAELAIRMERDVLEETVGFQDQITAAFGGLNVIRFSGKDRFEVSRVSVSKDKLTELDASLMMFFTGITRRASDVEKAKIENMTRKEAALKRMLRHVDEAHDVLTGNTPLSKFGALLDKTWKEKRSLDASVSNPTIDDMYERAMKAGALGGKLLGAGGGGFLLLFCPPERKPKVRKALARFFEVPFSINAAGSRIIHS